MAYGSVDSAVVIFPAGPADAEALARVHVQSWRETYRGLLPDAYLARMSEEAHARRFVHQFDPNCYLYLSRSMDWFDLAEYADGDLMAGLARIRVAKALAIGVHTDILVPLQQQEEIANGLRAGGAESEFVALPSPQGHDAFLVDIERFGAVIAGFLGRL